MIKWQAKVQTKEQWTPSLYQPSEMKNKSRSTGIWWDMITTVDETINISGETCLAFPSSWFTDHFLAGTNHHKPIEPHHIPGTKLVSKTSLSVSWTRCEHSAGEAGSLEHAALPLNNVEYPSEMGTQAWRCVMLGSGGHSLWASYQMIQCQ